MQTPQTPQTPQDELGLIGTEEAGKILGVSANTVTRYVERGILAPILRLPTGAIRFDKNYIHEKLDEFKRAAMPKNSGDAA